MHPVFNPLNEVDLVVKPENLPSTERKEYGEKKAARAKPSSLFIELDACTEWGFDTSFILHHTPSLQLLNRLNGLMIHARHHVGVQVVHHPN